ncbi:MAG TPA: ABC transporter ATP-binding protein [Candidatus Cryosericum sp.]|nr:ABC transporter ATP-binding protein [Candidatus Cryosericum sp.]
MSVPVVSVRDVAAGYAHVPPVLRQVFLDVMPGETVALVGRNGTGKSTLLRTIRGFLEPVHGEILFKGQNIKVLGPQRLASSMGFLSPSIPQAHITVDEVIELSSMGRLKTMDEFVASDHPDVFDEVVGFGARFLDEMSSGQQRKVMLLALVAQWTDVLLMDEPELHLDLPSLRELHGLISWASARGKSVVLSTHNLETIRLLPDRLYVVGDGTVREAPRTEATIQALMDGNGHVPDMRSQT